jgi:hypothetical protein
MQKTWNGRGMHTKFGRKNPRKETNWKIYTSALRYIKIDLKETGSKNMDLIHLG